MTGASVRIWQPSDQRFSPTTNDQRLTTVSKERLQHFRAAARQYSATNLDLMVQLRMVQDCHDRMHRTSFRVIGAIHQAADARMNQGAGAHGARFNCSKQFAVFQTVVTNRGTGFAQCHDLGVSRGVGVCDVAVPSAAHDSPGAYYDSPDGDLSRFEGALGAAQGFFHPQLVWGGDRC